MRILSEKRKGDVLWQAFVSDDRGRLAVRGIVEPSATHIVIDPLTERELRELLGEDGSLQQTPGELA